MNNNEVVHIQQMREALRREYEYEKAYYQQAKEALGLSRLITRGECWYPIQTGAVGYNAFGEMTVEVECLHGRDVMRGEESETEEENNKFEYGTSVVFFSTNQDINQPNKTTLNYRKWTGSVSFCQGKRMVIVVPNGGQVGDILGVQNLGVQLAFNERTYQLQFEALNKVEKASNASLMRLRSVLIGNQKPVFKNLPEIRFTWLNSVQDKAVNRALAAEDVMIVHGPPGTGKTTTLIEAIYETLRRETQVLVCAQSNAAVDWISSQLLDRGVPVLRIGNPSRVTDKMLSSTYERQFADHPRYADLWALRRALQDKHNHQERDRLRERYNVLEAEIRQQIFGNAKVIACTLAGAGHPLMHGQTFHTLFFDEAAQATEPACWVAIRRARRVIMAGDYQQLPPTLMSPEAAHGLLSHTLMEHVALRHKEAVELLNVQYRMHPDIMRFSSEWFYDGRLEAAPSVNYRGALDVDSALLWFDTSQCDWQEKQEKEGTSRYNPQEARFLIEQLEAYVDMLTVRHLMEENVDFAVISPYQAQIHLLRRLIRRSNKLRPIRKHITVETVDAFQGQERDVVILSFVRQNEAGQIGFLQDLRRINVAMTRARHKLMLVGDSATLSRHGFFKRLLEHVETYGRVVEIR